MQHSEQDIITGVQLGPTTGHTRIIEDGNCEILKKAKLPTLNTIKAEKQAQGFLT